MIMTLLIIKHFIECLYLYEMLPQNIKIHNQLVAKSDIGINIFRID